MSSPKTLNRPEPLGAHHQVAAFDCGALTLDEFLSRHALGNHQSGTAKTYVATTDSHIVVGYYSLAASQILYADAPSRLQKGAPRHPIPVVLLARLAVDRSWQGKGIGAGLLKDAISTRTKVALILVFQRAIPLKSSANVPARGAKCRNDRGGIPVTTEGIRATSATGASLTYRRSIFAGLGRTIGFSGGLAHVVGSQVCD
jgi:GNAT superfamily N-acetyltransferase